MSYELIYTSQQKGLIPGSSGFCIVAHTEGLVANVANVLVSCSGYKPLYPAHSESANLNPTAYCHYLWSGNGKKYSIVSRVGFAGIDYTQRDNKLAHHLVLEHDRDLKGHGAGVGWFFNSEFFLKEWNDEPHLINHPPIVKNSYFDAPQRIVVWKELAGSEAIAGVIAQIFREKSKKNIYVICNEFTKTLQLVYEVLALLTPEERWDFTFNTYAESVPQNLECFLRFCPANSASLIDARMSMNTMMIDLVNDNIEERHHNISTLCQPYINLECVQNAINDKLEVRREFLFELSQAESNLSKTHIAPVQNYDQYITSDATVKLEQDYQERVKQFTAEVINKHKQRQEIDKNERAIDEAIDQLNKTSISSQKKKSITYDEYQKKLKHWFIWTIITVILSIFIIIAAAFWFIFEFFDYKKDKQPQNNISIITDQEPIKIAIKQPDKNIQIKKTEQKSDDVIIQLKPFKDEKKVAIDKQSDEKKAITYQNEEQRDEQLLDDVAIELPPLTQVDLDSLAFTFKYCDQNIIKIPDSISFVKFTVNYKHFIDKKIIIETNNKDNNVKIYSKSPAIGKRLLVELKYSKKTRELSGVSRFINKSLQDKLDLIVNKENILLPKNDYIIIKKSKFNKNDSTLTFKYDIKGFLQNLKSNFRLKNVKLITNGAIIENKEIRFLPNIAIVDLKPILMKDKIVNKNWNIFSNAQKQFKEKNKSLETISIMFDWGKLEKVYDQLINKPRNKYSDEEKNYLKSFYRLRQSILTVVDKTKIKIKISSKSNLKSNKVYNINFIRKGGINE